MELLTQYSIIGSVTIIIGLIVLLMMLDELAAVDITVYLLSTGAAFAISYACLDYWLIEENCLYVKNLVDMCRW